MLKPFCRLKMLSLTIRLAVLFVILIVLFCLNPLFALADPEGPDYTGWYPIGPLKYLTREDAFEATGDPLSRSLSIEYWIDNLFNNYWGFSEEAIDYFLTYGQFKEVSLISLFPNFLDSDGNKVWWSWDQDYNNSFAYYDEENDLWWSPMRYALLDPDEERDLFVLYDYVVGRDCGNITDPSFSFFAPKVYGYKWDDKDGDGVRDDGEPVLSNWTIKLFDVSTNRTLMTTKTDSSGYFIFDLKGYKELLTYPRKVKVVEEMQDGWTNTYSPGGFYIYSSDIKSYIYGPKYFGNFRDAKIIGRKYKDENASYDRESGEPYLNGWKIILKKYGHPRGTVTTYTKDGVDGYFEFDGLTPGTYTIEEEVKDGWTPMEPKSGKYTITVKSGETHSGYYFGNFENTTIKGRKFLDYNGDGKRQNNDDEYYLNNWWIVLRGKGIEKWFKTKTLNGLDGSFEFTDIGPGTYTLEEEMTEDQTTLGWKRTYPESPGKHTVVVDESGKTYFGYLFGNFKAKISGRKFHDKDGDGRHDGEDDEPYLGGWSIKLTNQLTGKKVYDTTSYGHSSLTGSYEFTALSPGTYTVEEVLKEDWKNTKPGPGHDPPYKYTVEVSESKTYSGNNFGNFKVAKIRGIKYEDKDGDGMRDAGDSALSNWKIILTKPGGGKVTTTTSYNGLYKFEGLGPGTYTVEEVLKDGWIRTQPKSSSGKHTVVVNKSGETYGDDEDEDYNFGNFKKATIKGRKYNDENRNGMHGLNDKGEEEPYLNGWTINLLDKNDKIITAAYTKYLDGKKGSYKFVGLGPGTYKVEEELLSDDWENTQPGPSDDKDKNYRYTIKVESGETYDNNDFGNYYIPPGAWISGIKYNDLNGDGDYDPEDGEYPLSGWEIELTDHYGVPTSAVTKADGSYQFEVKPGSYTIEEKPTQQQIDEGWERTQPTSGYYEIEAEERGIYSGNDFGNYIPSGKIFGRKYNDLNRNGQHEPDPDNPEEGEYGLSNWEIILTKPDGTTVSYSTGADGYFEFIGLSPGTYKLEEVLKDGWINTEPSSGYYGIELKASQKLGEYLFGNYEIGSTIEGMKFIDTAGDGKYDGSPEDPPYTDGWIIKLTELGELGEPDITVTDINGNYRFEDVSLGIYQIEEEQTEGWTQTYPKQKTYIVFIDAKGKIYLGYDFGNFKNAEIGGIKYNDTNGDGQKQDTEPPLENWTIVLTKPGEEKESVTTAYDGTYKFTDLSPGTYYLEEEVKDGWINTEPESGQYTVVVSESGKTYFGYNFGNFEKIKITGRKYEDIKGNGRYDENTDSYLNGWTITLKKEEDPDFYKSTETTTAYGGDGYYEFTDLSPGTYRVEEELIDPNIWIRTQPSTGYYEIKAESGKTYENNDFGNFRYGSISGYKWDDRNEDGKWDESEPPLEGWKIMLYKKGSKEIQTTAYTNSEGYYSFTYLTGGKYFIREELKTGWYPTYPQEDFHIVCIKSGSVSENNNFGNFKLGIKSGYKWNDRYPDGVWDKLGEEGLNNWQMVLFKEDPITREYKTVAIEQTKTDENGSDGYYRFAVLHYGKYRVKEILKDGWMQTYPAEEDENGNLIPGYYEFFVESGFLEEENNFGNWNFGSFGKTKGFWMNWDNHFSLEEMQAFVSFVNENSTVYGEELFGFGYLRVEEIRDRLMTNNNIDKHKGGTTEFALVRLEAQFLATWLNIAAGFQSPDMIVHLDKVKGAAELYGANKLSLGEVIAITEERITQYKEYGTGWGHDEFVIAQKVFTMVNEAEENGGYIFRPVHISKL